MKIDELLDTARDVFWDRLGWGDDEASISRALDAALDAVRAGLACQSDDILRKVLAEGDVRIQYHSGDLSLGLNRSTIPLTMTEAARLQRLMNE